jgi:predicted metal-dependent phosphoesterase TrpH
MRYDLHTHTTASDGKLNPDELIERAERFNVDALSITDHDTIDAYKNIDQLRAGNVKIIPGIEFSTQWRKNEIHILGLNIGLQDAVINKVISQQFEFRYSRAKNISKKLSNLGIEDALLNAKKYAKGNIIGRPHFAEHLIATGHATNFQQAFKKYLAVGKPAFAKQQWTDIENIISSISASGGSAIIAHPMKYKLTRTKLLEFIADFKEYGGHGIEVVSGRQIPQVTRELASYCDKFNLYASCGSDFHRPDQSWAEIGQISKMPDSCTPVWTSWG